MAAERPGPRSANAAPAWSLLNAIPQAVAICADDWTILYVNRAASLLLDRTVESLIGTLIWETVPEARRVEFRERIVRAAESPSGTEPQQLPADHAPGHGEFDDRAWRVGDQVAVLFARVDEEPAAEATRQRLIDEVEAALRRSQLMLRASEAFLAATTTAEVCDAVSALMDGTFPAPRYVDIALLDGKGQHLVQLRPQEIPADIRHRFRRIPIGADLPSAEATRTGRGVFIQDLDELAERYPRMHTDWAAPDRQAIACAPVLGEDGPAGALVFVWAQPHPIDVLERAMLTTVAGYVGHAIARVRALEARVVAAETRYEDTQAALEMMQRRLLPERLPVLPGVRVAAYYRVADRENAAGGDWFDAVPVGDGTLALMVGDVVGHGAAAAAVMAQLRAVLSGLVAEGAGVVEALARLDRIAARIPGARGATVCLAVLDPDSRTVRYASCGHPPPLVVGRDRTSRYLSVHGGPLGVAGPEPRLGEDVLVEADMVLLYSDGLVERPGRAMGAGLTALSNAAVNARGGESSTDADPDHICAQIMTRLAHPGHDDDITVLAAELGERSNLSTIGIDSRRPGLAAVRATLGAWLTRLGAGDEDVGAIQLAVMEAVENAIEHGYRDAPGEVRVDAHLDRRGRACFVVTDQGRWRQPSTHPRHRGRGFALMHDCAADVEIERLATGTAVSFNRELSRPPVFGDVEAVREEPRGTDDELSMDLRQRGDRLMLVLSGPIDLTSSAVLRRQLQNLTRGGSTPLSMNLGAVTHIGSSGVDVLYEVAEEMRHAGHTMQLVAPSGSPAHHVLGLSGLEHITQHLEYDRFPDEHRGRS